MRTNSANDRTMCTIFGASRDKGGILGKPRSWQANISSHGVYQSRSTHSVKNNSAASDDEQAYVNFTIVEAIVQLKYVRP